MHGVPSCPVRGAQPFDDFRRYAVARFQDCNLDGPLKTEKIGAAVTLDDDAAQAHHRRAIVASRVQARTQSVERGLCRECPQLACKVAPELRAQRILAELRGPFD